MSDRERRGLLLFVLLVAAYVFIDTKKDNANERLVRALEQRIATLEQVKR